MGLKFRNPFKKKKHLPAPEDLNWQENPSYSSGRMNPLFEPQAQTMNTPTLDQIEDVGGVDDGLFDEVQAPARHKAKDSLKGRHIRERHIDADDVSDSAHEVQRIDYKREIGRSGTTEGFFKPEHWAHGSYGASDAGIGNERNAATEEQDADMDIRLIARSLASTRLNRRLEQDTLAEEVQARHDGRWGVTSAKTSGTAATEFDGDLSHPEIQRGLANLQVMDWLTGQVDRHDGNIFIDPETGKVRGIDNDLAFGTDNEGMKSGDAAINERFLGLPEQIDARMADMVQGLSEDELRELLTGEKGDHNHLNEDEIAAAVERLEVMKRFIDGEEVDGRSATIVEEWNEATYFAGTESVRDEDGELRQSTGFRSEDPESRSYAARLAFRQGA